MTAVNPYAPPGAAVDDVGLEDGAVHPVRTWSRKGRIGRLRYVAHLTGAYLIMLLTAVATGALLAAVGLEKAAEPVGALLGLAWTFFAAIKSVQRSHDMDWSGWSVLALLIPFVVLVWMFKGGTKGNNRFGAPAPANTLGVKILGLVVPLLMFVGFAVLIAAVAVPAYNKYTERARAAQMK